MVVKDAPPASGGSKVQMLRGNDYLRVWINRGGNHYLIHFPVAGAAAPRRRRSSASSTAQVPTSKAIAVRGFLRPLEPFGR